MNVPSAIRTVKTPVIPPSEQEESLGRLYDALIESWDDGETIYSSASEWPETTDEDIAMVGAPLDDSECFQPDETDCQAYLDMLERAEVERALGINMRFR